MAGWAMISEGTGRRMNVLTDAELAQVQAEAWSLGHVDGQDFARGGEIRLNPYLKGE